MRITRRVRGLSPFVHGEQPRGLDVIKLNTNEAAYPPSRKVMAELGKIAPESLRRYPDAEFSDLRVELARLHRTRKENVFVGNGSDEILSLLTGAFVEDDEIVCTLDPSYSLYRALASIRGVEWRGIEWGADGLKSRPPAKCSLFIWTNPNNPTGTLVPARKIAALARSFRGVVAVDEAYADYASSNCLGLATSSRNRNVIVMRTFSKAYSLAGLRVGYCIGPADLIGALYRIKESYNVDAVAQQVACAAVRDQAGLRSTVRKVLKTRARFVAALAKRGWDVIPSEANFVFARPPVAKPGTAGRDAFAVAKHVFETLRERKIFIRYFDGPKTGDRVRITIGTDAQMKSVLRAIDDILSGPA